MDIAENTVWAMMAGGLMSLALLAAADALLTRSVGAVRNLLLILSISATAVVLSGLPEALLPALPPRLSLLLQVGLTPLSGALGLRFLGIWVGGGQEDRLVQRLTVWGAYGLMLAALALMLGAVLGPPGRGAAPVLWLAALVSELVVVLVMVVAVRAAVQGDPLARWLVLAGVVQTGMITGLYLRALGVPGLGLGARIFTAICTVVFVLIVMMLIIVRNRESRRLARLSRLEAGVDPATGLATGSKLLSEMEHAFWRTGRLRGKCVVVCVYLGNLYELGEALGKTGENQILAATAARLRRAVGFRCVVGMYHPRCFVVVISTERRRVVDDAVTQRIRALVTQPMSVVLEREGRQQFVPQAGVAMLTVQPDHVQPQTVIDELEQLAMAQVRRPVPADEDGHAQDGAATRW